MKNTFEKLLSFIFKTILDKGFKIKAIDISNNNGVIVYEVRKVNSYINLMISPNKDRIILRDNNHKIQYITDKTNLEEELKDNI